MGRTNRDRNSYNDELDEDANDKNAKNDRKHKRRALNTEMNSLLRNRSFSELDDDALEEMFDDFE
jgi:hypothetical protein